MPDNYYQNLPKKRMGAGLVLLNSSNEVLLVKPSYNEHWLLPGGVVEKNESPRQACLREAHEEIGLELSDAKLLCVDYNPDRGEKDESLQFVFFGGVLSEEQIKMIKVDGSEIIEYKFVSFSEALSLLGDKSQKRTAKSLEALKNNSAIYLENGE